MLARGPTTLLLVVLAAAAYAREGGDRNARYCEIVPVLREGLQFHARVYSTFRHSDCPPDIWDAVTEEAMKQRFGAVAVILNGPRYFVVDSVAGSGATKSGETIEAGGLTLAQRATLEFGLLDLLRRPYRETTVNVEVTYTFKAGQPVFVLESGSGPRYVMQSYGQIVDKTLAYADLPTLGNRLNLPSGWRYSAMVPDKDLVVRVEGHATVVQDDLGNTYQKLD